MYLVIEIQKTGATIAQIVNTYADRNTAEQKYHTVLAAAAVSSVDIHSAVLMFHDGTVFKKESYDHTIEEQN